MAKYSINPNNPGALVALDDEAAKVLDNIDTGPNAAENRSVRRESFTETKDTPNKTGQSLGPSRVKVAATQIELEKAFRAFGLTAAEAKIAANLNGR
jgi:hypothetical protein